MTTMIGALIFLTTATTAAVEPAATRSLKLTLALELGLTLNVADSQAAADALIAKAEQLGGYFADRGDQLIVLKVPSAQADAAIAFGETLGTVLQRSRAAQDLRATLREQRTRVRSKRKMLSRYLEVLAAARASAVVTVEREVTQLIQEIESLEGAIRMLEQRLSMATLRVSFQIKKRRVPVADGTSPFPWLNTVNLVDLYDDFRDEPR